MITNEYGQIIADQGIQWQRVGDVISSYDPMGYFIDHQDCQWELFRKTKSSYPEKIPFVRQRLMRGTASQCMQAAEIYEIRRVL